MSRLIRTFPALEVEPVRVLVCEDVAEIRQLLRHFLAAEPGTDLVGEAADGGQAVRLAESTAPEVILLDLGMPGPTPVELVDGIARAAPNAALVLYSGRSGSILGRHRRLIKIELPKSTPPGVLVQRVRDLGWARRDAAGTSR